MQIYEMLIPLKPPRFYFDENISILKGIILIISNIKYN